MNKFSSKDIIKNLSKANMISISPLEMIVRNKNNQIKKSIAINEVSVLRQSRQAALLSIKQGSRQIIKKLVSDGVLVSAPRWKHCLQPICSWTYIKSSFKEIIHIPNQRV